MKLSLRQQHAGLLECDGEKTTMRAVRLSLATGSASYELLVVVGVARTDAMIVSGSEDLFAGNQSVTLIACRANLGDSHLRLWLQRC
jgi:hypothetical protein